MKDTFVRYSIVLGGALVLVLVAGILGGIIGYGHGKRSSAPTEVVKTDTIRTTDTIKLPAPPPDTVTLTKVKTVKVPLHDTMTLVDSVWVDLPFEQHFARLDSVADVWYSGYEAKIDSATIYKHQRTVVERHYITEPSKPNIIGIEAGTRDASVMYMRQLGAFYVGISAGSTYEGKATAKGIVGIRF
jgi:hypothetical protein